MLSCLLACAQKAPIKHGKDGFKFSPSEVYELLTLLKVDSASNEKIHVKYSEHLNDSSFIMSIWQNQKLPTKDLEVCEILKYHRSIVFIYDGSCSYIIPDDFKSKDKQSPFFIPDSGFWEVLALKRNGKMGYYRISFFVSHSYNQENLDEWR
jgi:hypothetical protein